MTSTNGDIRRDFSFHKDVDVFLQDFKNHTELTFGEKASTYLDELTYMGSLCQSYRELGTGYGASMVAAMLGGAVKEIECVDIDFIHFDLQSEMIINFARDNVISVYNKVDDSISTALWDPEPMTTGFLLIDTVYTYDMVTRQLNCWCDFTNKYIMIRGTRNPAVQSAVNDFLKRRSEWHIKQVFSDRLDTIGFNIISK